MCKRECNKWRGGLCTLQLRGRLLELLFVVSGTSFPPHCSEISHFKAHFAHFFLLGKSFPRLGCSMVLNGCSLERD